MVYPHILLVLLPGKGSPFGTVQSAGKAVYKAKKALPRSPRKAVHVLRHLANEYSKGETATIISEESRGRKTLSDSTTRKVIHFYESDEISRMMPGKKDSIKVDGSLVQKRYLYNNLSETYELFKADNPDDVVGRSKFASLRPQHVLPVDGIPHSVCVCAIHENMRFLIECLKKVDSNLPGSGRELVDSCLCDRKSTICMQLSGSGCVTCKSPSEIYS